LEEYFDEITYHHILREENQLADALATLSSMYKVTLASYRDESSGKASLLLNSRSRA